MGRALVLLVTAAAIAGCGGQAESSPAGGGSGGTGGTGGSYDGGSGGTGNAPSDSGLDTTPADVTLPPGQNILFEVSYENFAWQPSLNGVFITSDGSVYSYDFFAGDAGAQPPAVVYPATEQEIRARYGDNPVKTGTIPLVELAAEFSQVSATASGVLLRQYLCADAGESTALGYLFDEATARYSPVILGVDGDQSALNLAPEAAGLVAWLSQYLALGGSCAFTGKECGGATCGTPAPSCPSDQLPSVVDGCWSICVPSGECLSVSDCSQCADGAVCATAKDGSSHCLMSNCASADACTCPFMPPCAGGSAYCTSTGPLRVTCGK
jgi:hypothetical protein